MSRSKSVLAIALVLGALAAIAGYAGLKATAAQVAQNTSKHYVPVVVTATDLTFGTKLDRAQLRTVKYPKESVPAGAFSDVDSVVGQTTKIFMTSKEPITATKLSSRGGGLSMLVRTGLRATSLEVNQVSGVSGFVLPGDRVDVLCTVDGRGADQQAETRTILQNVEVLASGQKTAQQDNKPITVQAVTILVDPMGAEKLALGLHEGQIHLVLRNPEDSDMVTVAGMTTSQMVNGSAPRVAKSSRKRAAMSKEQLPAVERRVVSSDVRAKRADDGPSVLEGYAAVFNRETVIDGWFPFREVIIPGAFTEAMRDDEILGLWNHDPNYVLGRTGNKTLRLSEDAVGLAYEIDVNAADPQAVGIAARVERGDVHTSSFAFQVGDDGDEWDESEVKNGKLPLRKITKVARLFDTSPVAYAAYSQTTVSARAEARAKELAAAPETPKPEAPAQRTFAADPDSRRREMKLKSL